MEELILNFHIHSVYSDGTGCHADIAKAALLSNVDVIVVTDHNVLVQGLDGYYQNEKRKVLLLTGEEIHHQRRYPQKSHLLVFGANRELATYAGDVGELVNQVHRAGGLALIAHPFENALPLFGEREISWEDWQIDNIDGMEIWNGLSELKSVIKTRLGALIYAAFPQLYPRGANPAALQKWDELLQQGKYITAIAGADAHAMHARMGIFNRTLFPYEFHFRTINNHLLTESQLTGDVLTDKKMIFQALQMGRLHVGYDLPASTRGFRFTAHGRDGLAQMGEKIHLAGGVTFQIRIPQEAECVLLKDGKAVKKWTDQKICTYITNRPGCYRVECYITYWGRRRGWIFSNPIVIYDNQ